MTAQKLAKVTILHVLSVIAAPEPQSPRTKSIYREIVDQARNDKTYLCDTQ